MIDQLNSITQIIQGWGAWGVFFGGIIEQIIIPIPSPVIPMAGGFFLIQKQIPFLSALKTALLKVAIPFSLGSTLGSSFVFLIAFFGGVFLINKFSRYIGFSWQDIERFKNRFFKRKSTDELLIFVFMAIPVIPSSFVSAVAGAIRVKPIEFYLFAFLGLFTRGVILGVLGWWVGEAYWTVANGLNRVESILFIVFGLIFFALLFLGYLKRDKWLKKEI